MYLDLRDIFAKEHFPTLEILWCTVLENYKALRTFIFIKLCLKKELHLEPLGFSPLSVHIFKITKSARTIALVYYCMYKHLKKKEIFAIIKLWLKGTVPRDFWLQVFTWISFPQAPEFPIRAVSNFSKICGDIRSLRCTTGVVDTGKKWKKSQIRKDFNILFGHLWVVELTYS